MEYIQAQKLREQWGDKPCDHYKFEKLYYTGAFLVTYVCTDCGAEFTIPQKMEIEEQRKISKPKQTV